MKIEELEGDVDIFFNNTMSRLRELKRELKVSCLMAERFSERVQKIMNGDVTPEIDGRCDEISSKISRVEDIVCVMMDEISDVDGE